MSNRRHNCKVPSPLQAFDRVANRALKTHTRANGTGHPPDSLVFFSRGYGFLFVPPHFRCTIPNTPSRASLQTIVIIKKRIGEGPKTNDLKRRSPRRTLIATTQSHPSEQTKLHTIVTSLNRPGDRSRVAQHLSPHLSHAFLKLGNLSMHRLQRSRGPDFARRSRRRRLLRRRCVLVSVLIPMRVVFVMMVRLQTERQDEHTNLKRSVDNQNRVSQNPTIANHSFYTTV